MSLIVQPSFLGFAGKPAGGSGLPASDNFNRADNSSSLGTSSSGHTWSALRGTWGINSNQGYMATNGNGQNYVVIDVGAANITVECTFPTATTGCGVSFRGTDESNIFIWYKINSSLVNCYKRVSGSYTELFSLSESMVDGDTLKVVCNGNSIELYRNGTLKTTLTESFNNTAPKHGLYKEGSSTTARWDTFSIT